MTDKELVDATEMAGNSGELSSEETQKSEYTEFQQQCIDAGWDPNGSKDEFKWALNGLKVRNEKITDLYKITDNLKDMMSKQEQIALDKARRELQQAKDAAIERGDKQAVYQIEQHQQNQETHNEVATHASDFINKNASWYKDTSYEALKMQKACREMDIQLANQKLAPNKHFEALNNYMHGEFPSYFGSDEAPKRAQAVEGASSAVMKSSSKKEYTYDDLNDDQKFWAVKYEKLGLYTKKQYISELIKTGALK